MANRDRSASVSRAPIHCKCSRNVFISCSDCSDTILLDDVTLFESTLDDATLFASPTLDDAKRVTDGMVDKGDINEVVDEEADSDDA